MVETVVVAEEEATVETVFVEAEEVAEAEADIRK